MAPVLALFLVLNMAPEVGPRNHTFSVASCIIMQERSNAPNAGGTALPFSSGAPLQCYGRGACAAVAPARIPAGPPGSDQEPLTRFHKILFC